MRRREIERGREIGSEKTDVKSGREGQVGKEIEIDR